MEFLRTNLPMIMMIIGGVVLVAFMAYSFFRDDEEDDDEDDLVDGSGGKLSSSSVSTLDVPEAEARKSRMIALKDSLERSLQTRAGAKSSSLDRMALPWFMLVGTENSGKRNLLASTGLPLPYGPPVEVDSTKRDAGRWWLFEDAVVVEAPTVKPAPKAAAPNDSTAHTAMIGDGSEGWNNLLHLLRRDRPDSPLNGIIVTLSCADLTGSRRKNPEELTEQAEQIKAFLERTRRVLGMRLPVHIIVNRCDIMPGFRSFAETLPEGRRDDIFGWANPRPLEKTFDPSWIDEGFAEVQHGLEALHDELLAAPEVVGDADGLFVFVNEFDDLRDSLVDFVSKMMPASERRPSLFLRGVYFTGDPSERAARAAAIESDDNATLHISMEAAEAESHSLVFLRSLFAEKIFKEAGLARTASPIRISRDFRVLGAQAAALVIALLGGAGLWASLYGFQRGDTKYGTDLTEHATELSRLMSGVAIDLDQVKRRDASGDSALERRLQNAAVINLVNEMRSITAENMRSLFVPSSWFSPLPRQIRATVLNGLQSVVLPIAHQRLQERIRELLGNGRNTVVADLDPSDPKSLATYLAEVRTLNQNISRYNALAGPDSGAPNDLGALVDYLFGERLTIDTAAVTDEFEEALRIAEAPRVTLTPAQTNGVVLRAVGLVDAIADSATRQLTGRGSSRPEDDLRALRRLKDLADLSRADSGLTATVSDATPTGRRVAKSVQDSIALRVAVAGTRVLRDSLLADQAGQRLRSVLTYLFATRLLEPIEGRAIADELRPGMTLRWDIGQLELALALRGELRRAQIAASDAFPAATNARLRTAFDVQMRSRLIDLVADAQRFTPDTVAPLNEIRATTANIDAASDRLARVAALLDTLRSADEGRKLYAIGTRQAEQVLALAQHLLDSARYLAPHPTSVASWRGGYPIGFAALGVTDTGAFNLRLDQEQIVPIQTLATSVTPALAFLRQPSVTPAMISSPKLVADWRGIVAAAGPEPTSTTLVNLYEYLRVTLGPIDQPTCQAAALRADGPRVGNDWFTMRRGQFRAALLGRCHPGGSGDAIASYGRLRALFTAKLAGKYPFVDSSKAATAPDAEPAAVREFYQAYDQFARSHDVMLRSDPRVVASARQAFTFLDQVAAARPFFAAFIDSAMARRAPQYAFTIEPLAAGESAELHIFPRVTLLNDSTQAGTWSYGEPVRITAAGDTAKVTFRSSGSWGLVELGTQQRAVRVRFYHPDTKVRVALPTFPLEAPAIR